MVTASLFRKIQIEVYYIESYTELYHKECNVGLHTLLYRALKL